MADRLPAPRLAALGKLANGAHILPLRVYWEDTDAFGIVYYANYLRFLERGRSDILRLAGIDQAKLHAEGGIGFAVRRCDIEYLLPARLDDDIEVHSTLTGLRGATLTAIQVVKRGAADLARATIRLACLDRSGRPRRVPADLIRALATVSPNLSANSAA